MGLDAKVFCNCLRDGKLKTKPPVDLERIYIDWDEGMVEVRDPADMEKQEQDDLWYMVSHWAENCCEHEGMHFCSLRVGNWSSVRSLQQAVESTGKYPVLASIFPRANGGTVGVETALLASHELERFCQEVCNQKNAFLVDAKTGDTIYSYINCYDGVFSMDGHDGIDIGFDRNGLFVRDRKTGEERFRALHCHQKLLPERQRTSPDGKIHTVIPARLTDLVSGRRMEIGSAIGWRRHPSRLEVVERILREEDFYAIGPLRQLFQAVRDTGNPIHWW